MRDGEQVKDEERGRESEGERKRDEGREKR